MIEDIVHNFGEMTDIFVRDQKLDLLLKIFIYKNKIGPLAHTIIKQKQTKNPKWIKGLRMKV